SNTPDREDYDDYSEYLKDCRDWLREDSLDRIDSGQNSVGDLSQSLADLRMGFNSDVVNVDTEISSFRRDVNNLERLIRMLEWRNDKIQEIQEELERLETGEK
ncbi:MAG: hypothetical protein SV377_05940, partial [Halobacteria archaeon]|nr:hypothetical protein [Halobacteria archaeon]